MERELWGLLPRGRARAGSFVLRVLSLWQAGTLGEVSAEYSSVLQVCSLRVMVSTDWSAPGQGVFSH